MTGKVRVWHVPLKKKIRRNRTTLTVSPEGTEELSGDLIFSFDMIAFWCVMERTMTDPILSQDDYATPHCGI